MKPAFSDGQIAAIAATQGLVLVTRNTSDFEVFEGLEGLNWFRELRVCLGQLAEPIARVLPMVPQNRRPDHAELRQRMPLLGSNSADLIRDERDER